MHDKRQRHRTTKHSGTSATKQKKCSTYRRQAQEQGKKTIMRQDTGQCNVNEPSTSGQCTSNSSPAPGTSLAPRAPLIATHRTSLIYKIRTKRPPSQSRRPARASEGNGRTSVQSEALPEAGSPGAADGGARCNGRQCVNGDESGDSHSISDASSPSSSLSHPLLASIPANTSATAVGLDRVHAANPSTVRAGGNGGGSDGSTGQCRA